MTKLARLASYVDRIGLRRLLAAGAGLAYRDRRFSIDAEGRWINSQADGVIVSQTINTMPFSAIGDAAARNWLHEYSPKLGDIIVDVGAGVGDEVIYFSKLVGPTGRVVAIEASPTTFACLQETVKRSGLTNVTCLSLAVSSDEGYAWIEDRDAHLANSIGGSDGIRVRATSLDILFDELNLAKIDLLKMNIEGAERLAIRGIGRHAIAIRHAAISCHDFLAPSEGDSFYRTKKDVILSLKNLGFKVVGREPVEGEPWVEDYLYATR